MRIKGNHVHKGFSTVPGTIHNIKTVVSVKVDSKNHGGDR